MISLYTVCLLLTAEPLLVTHPSLRYVVRPGSSTQLSERGGGEKGVDTAYQARQR
jgi:hypothetical protein